MTIWSCDMFRDMSYVICLGVDHIKEIHTKLDISICG